MKIEYVQKVLQEKTSENAKIVKINIDELDLSIQETSLFIEFAKKELFPDAKRIVVVDYADFSKQVEIKNSDYVIVITNGHTKDTLVLESLLKNPPAYIGVIGSRHKKIHVENYLAEKGFSEDLIKQIIMPIGLDIKAETPSEIAISIVAQLIQKRAQ